MGLAVKTVAAGGLPVVETTRGTPVTESPNAYGVSVTKVVGKPYGLPVTFETIGVVAPVVYPVFDQATITAATLSGGGLVVTNTGTTSADQGAKVASASGKTTGKFYIEDICTNRAGGGNTGVGIGTTASTYTGMGGSAVSGCVCFLTGTIWAGGTNTGENIGALVNGLVIGKAIDLTNRKIWYRVCPAGFWFGNVNNNPVTNIGGVTIPAGVMVPFVVFGGTGGLAGNVFTANFGASPFVGAVPSGYTAGWPA